MNGTLAYAIGFHPWEDTDPPFAATLSDLLTREEKRTCDSVWSGARSGRRLRPQVKP